MWQSCDMCCQSVEAEDAALGDVDLDHTLTDTQSVTTDDQTTSDTGEASESAQGSEPVDAARRSCISLLRELVDALPTLTDKGGVGIIPLMQVRVRVPHHTPMALYGTPPHPYGTVWDMHLCYTGKKYTFLPWAYRSFPSSITVEAFLVVSISERLILLHAVLFSEGPEVKCARLVSVISARVPNKWLSAHSVLCLPLSVKVVLALCTHLDLRGRERRVLAEVLQKCFKAVNFASPVSPVSSTPSISSLQKIK